VSLKVSGPSPIIVAMWNPTQKKDLCKNLVIESVIQVFFPTLEKLIPTLTSIRKNSPAQLTIYRQSHTEDVVAVAKIAMFSIATEGIKHIVAQEALDRVLEAADDPLESSQEPDDFLYPVIVAISEPTRKKSGDIQVVESKLSIHLAAMDNWLETEKMVQLKDPKAEIQTHMRSTKDTVLALADFMVRAADEQHANETGIVIGPKGDMAASVDSAASASSILAALKTDYFTGGTTEEL
jgi:hypothetical protein